MYVETERENVIKKKGYRREQIKNGYYEKQFKIMKESEREGGKESLMSDNIILG